MELTSFGELVTLTGCKATVVLALRTSGGRQVQKTSCILRHLQHAVAEFPLPQQLGCHDKAVHINGGREH